MSTQTIARAGLSLALCAAPLAAQAIADGVETITVSAVRAESAQLPVAAGLTIIDREQIRASGAQQVSEVLRTQAGIQLFDTDGSGRNATLAMRGFSGSAANNTLVLVDGRKLNNPSLAGPALNTVALQDIERIEIMQGSAGVLYGDQAVGGVINIVTRRARAGEELAQVQALRGSHDREEYSASFSQGFHSGFSYRLSGQKRVTDNYRDNSDQNYENWLANLSYEVAEGRLYVERQQVDDRLRLPGALSDAQAAENPRQSTNPDDFSNQKTDLSRYGVVWHMAPGWSFLTDVADRDERVQAYLWGPIEQRTQVHNLSPRVVGQFATPAGPATLTAGYDRMSAEYERVGEWSSVSAEQTTSDFYSQLIYPLNAALTLSLGMRRSEVEDSHSAIEQDNKDTARAKEVGVNYQVSSQWRLFGRRADGFRYANVDENALTINTQDEDGNLVPAFLDVQQSQTYELGLGWQRGTSQWLLTLYRMTVEGEIAYDSGVENPASFNGFGANVNLPDAKRRGLVTEYSQRLGEAWQLSANYTYTDAELSSGGFAGNDQPYVAANVGNLMLGYAPSQAFNLYLDASYTGRRYRLSDEANSEGKLSSYVLLNLNLILVDNHWELGLRVNNLADKDYATYHEAYGGGFNVQYPQAGRSYEARLTYTF